MKPRRVIYHVAQLISLAGGVAAGLVGAYSYTYGGLGRAWRVFGWSALALVPLGVAVAAFLSEAPRSTSEPNP